MEKSGIGKRGKRDGGLLNGRRLSAACTLFLLCLPLASLPVSLETSAAEVAVDGEITLNLKVFGAALSDTSFDFGMLPRGFSLAGSKKESARLENPDEPQAGPQSAVVFTLILRADVPGIWDIGPFSVKTGNEGYNLGAVPLRILGTPPEERSAHSLQWAIGGSGEIRAGDERLITLMGPRGALGGDILCPAPENALLEALPLPSEPAGLDDASPAALARFRWTPLSPGEQRLPSASVTIARDGSSLESVPAAVQVLPALENHRSAGDSPEISLAFSAQPEAKTPTGSDSGDAKKPDFVERLTALRAAEYRALFPGKITKERQALEREAGLRDTLPVPRSAWKLPSVLGSVLSVALALFLSLVFGRRKPARNLGIAAAIAGLALAFFAVSLYIRDNRPAGIALSGPLYNVPEYGSRTLELVQEGTAFLVLREAGGWVYAESPAGVRGWIPEDRFRLYAGAFNESERTK